MGPMPTLKMAEGVFPPKMFGGGAVKPRVGK